MTALDDARAVREALAEAAEGRGAFSQDQYAFACNVIESMKSIIERVLPAARRIEALAGAEPVAQSVKDAALRIIEFDECGRSTGNCGSPYSPPTAQDAFINDALLVAETLYDASPLATDAQSVRVPREPTEAMLVAAFAATVWPDLNRATSADVLDGLRENMRKEYRAMLSASKEPKS